MPPCWRRLIASVILFTCLFRQGHGSSMSTLVRVACQRDPSLSFCQETPSPAPALNGVPTATRQALTASPGATLSSNDVLLLEDIAASVKRAGGNPFEKTRAVRQGERKDSDLREKEKDPEEGFIEEEGEHGSREPAHREPAVKETVMTVEEASTAAASLAPSTTEDTEEANQGFKGEKAEYCDNYEQHFSFYCVGDHSNDLSAGKFCKSYKKACPNKKGAAGSGSTSWPSDPFEKSVAVVPLAEKPVEKVRAREEEFEIDDQPTEQDLYYAELKKRFPCKPDCDSRLFPHCTAECKCDYAYPSVQRFCNPPPMPMFLNTCRLWYHGCPRYDSYHYASQFIYSKAEKGKVLPGFANNVNPYGIPQPTALRPLARGAATHSEEILYVPPPLPPGYKEKLRQDRVRSERVDVLEEVSRRHRRDRERRKRRRRLTARRRSAPSTPRPPTRKELYKTLKALSALTADPARLTKDIIGQGAGGESSGGSGAVEESASRPRAQGPGFPVIPSDAAYGAAADPFKKFEGLTDSRGILHRPRSSSPFTKPGLWAANPDDPHNRDHANKYYYAPSSVGVDWLNGQLQWGAHWAVPAAQVGGTNGFSAVHFPTIGNFLNIPDDYD